jgi:hypothetical protein
MVPRRALASRYSLNAYVLLSLRSPVSVLRTGAQASATRRLPLSQREYSIEDVQASIKNSRLVLRFRATGVRLKASSTGNFLGKTRHTACIQAANRRGNPCFRQFTLSRRAEHRFWYSFSAGKSFIFRTIPFANASHRSALCLTRRLKTPPSHVFSDRLSYATTTIRSGSRLCRCR